MSAERALAEFRGIAADLSGLQLGDNKAYLVEHRLGPVAKELGCSLDELAARARRDPALARRCTELLLTYESFWFRDQKPFDAVAELMGDHAGPGPFKVLSLACSTGQEPYSVALLATRRWGDLAPAHLKVLACDISDVALSRAREGVYEQTEVSRGLPAQLLSRHFRRQGSRWELDPSVRRLVEFRQADLRGTLPATPGGWDLVLCRNVLIYMDAATREQVVAAVARQLRPGGHLLLGSGEPSPPAPAWSSERVAGCRVFRRQA